MNTAEAPTTDKPTPTKKKSPAKKRIAFSLVAALLVAGLAFGWFGLHNNQSKAGANIAKLQSQLDEANKAIDALQTDSKKLDAKADDLAKKLAATSEASSSNSSAASQTPTYTVQMDRYHRQAANKYSNTGIDVAFVNLNIKNGSNAEGYIATSDIRLKDSSNQTYSSFSHPTPYPNSMQPLESQSIKAGETIAGALAFQIPSGTKTFTLTFGDVEVALDLSTVSPSYY